MKKKHYKEGIDYKFMNTKERKKEHQKKPFVLFVHNAKVEEYA